MNLVANDTLSVLARTGRSAERLQVMRMGLAIDALRGRPVDSSAKKAEEAEEAALLVHLREVGDVLAGYLDKEEPVDTPRPEAASAVSCA